MKILWVTYFNMTCLADFLKNDLPISGSWLNDLSQDLALISDIDLHIISPGTKTTFNLLIKDGIHYHSIKMTNFERTIRCTNRYKREVEKVLDNIQPDLIHIQGSEFPAGQAFINQSKIPTVLSVQGLISEINKSKFYYGGLGLVDIGFIEIVPLFLRQVRNKFRAMSEVSQISKIKNLIGRTNWDEAHIKSINPNCNYFEIQEVIRSSFFINEWNIEKIEPYSIFCGGGYAIPLKGFHHILLAAEKLKKLNKYLKIVVVGPDIRSVRRTGYVKYLIKLISKHDLWDNITFTGNLQEHEMAKEFLRSNVYVMGSSIENSSNTFGEALCLGVPSVVPFVGGIHSLAHDEQSALFYNYGDVDQMAWQIKRIFDNSDLALKLHKNSVKRAQLVYSKEIIVKSIYSLYRELCNN